MLGLEGSFEFFDGGFELGLERVIDDFLFADRFKKSRDDGVP